MRAAWDWDLPRDTADQEREIVECVAACGFDTLIIDRPTTVITERADSLGIDVVAIIQNHTPEHLRDECLQQVHPVEERFVSALADAPGDFHQLGHRWFPHVHDTQCLCLEHERSLEHIEERVGDALDVADGVAFDGFGFRNHYACFCERCEDRRDARAEARREHRFETVREVSRAQLIEASRRLYEFAKSEDRDALVTNHVWPPFAPDPYYGRDLHVDYCSQTISWFYQPTWSLPRVEWEATEHNRLEGDANTFVPFIGLFDDAYQRRSPDRLRGELEIALEYGDGNVVLSTLAVPWKHAEYARVLKRVLT